MSRFNRHLVPLLSPMLSGDSLRAERKLPRKPISEQKIIMGRLGRLVGRTRDSWTSY